MANSIGKHLKELASMVEEFTKDHDIRTAKGGHVSITLRHEGNHRTVFSPATPGDRRSMLNVRTKIKHAFLQLETLACA